MDSLTAVQSHPCATTVLAEGELTWIPMSAMAWVNARNEIAIAVAADSAEVGRCVVVRLWRENGSLLCRSAVFEADGKCAIAAAVIGPWDGSEFTALTLYPRIEAGEEC
jgi:hypothetical protein